MLEGEEDEFHKTVQFSQFLTAVRGDRVEHHLHSVVFLHVLTEVGKCLQKRSASNELFISCFQTIVFH